MKLIVASLMLIVSASALAHEGHGAGVLGHEMEHAVWYLALAIAGAVSYALFKDKLQKIKARRKA